MRFLEIQIFRIMNIFSDNFDYFNVQNKQEPKIKPHREKQASNTIKPSVDQRDSQIVKSKPTKPVKLPKQGIYVQILGVINTLTTPCTIKEALMKYNKLFFFYI